MQWANIKAWTWKCDGAGRAQHTPEANVSGVCRHSENWTNGRRYTPLKSWIRSAGVGCNFMRNIFKDRKLGLQKGTLPPSPPNNHCFQKKNTEALGQTGSPSKGRDLPLVHPSAPQLSDPFGYNQQGRHGTCSLNSHKANSQGLMGSDEQVCATKKSIHIYVASKHRADWRAPRFGQHLELGMSEKEGDQEPTSALGHGEGMGRQAPSRGRWGSRRAELPFRHTIARGCQSSRALHRLWHIATISHLPQTQPARSVQSLIRSFNTGVNLFMGYLLSDSKGLEFPTLPSSLQPWVTWFPAIYWRKQMQTTRSRQLHTGSVILAISTEQDRILYIDFKANKRRGGKKTQGRSCLCIQRVSESKGHPSQHRCLSPAVSKPPHPAEGDSRPADRLLRELTDAHCTRGKITRPAIPRNL